MHNDDRPKGTMLTRRQLVAMFGASAATALGATALGDTSLGAAASTTATGGNDIQAFAPHCIAIPQQTEGPYFVDEKLLRSDIRTNAASGRIAAGVPLQIQLRVASIGGTASCTPMAGALVDIWHCDANGVYSDVEDRRVNTKGQTFLRGFQVSDAKGIVNFTTVYPGWYQGRAVHIHFKIRTPQAGAERGSEFTSQLYFDEALTNRVHATEAYVTHKGQRLLNERDMIFREGGAQLMLPVSDTDGGLATSFNVAIDPQSQTVEGPGGSRPRPGGRGRGGRGPA